MPLATQCSTVVERLQERFEPRISRGFLRSRPCVVPVPVHWPRLLPRSRRPLPGCRSPRVGSAASRRRTQGVCAPLWRWGAAPPSVPGGTPPDSALDRQPTRGASAGGEGCRFPREPGAACACGMRIARTLLVSGAGQRSCDDSIGNFVYKCADC